jgi:hypothetical protein
VKEKVVSWFGRDIGKKGSTIRGGEGLGIFGKGYGLGVLNEEHLITFKNLEVQRDKLLIDEELD